MHMLIGSFEGHLWLLFGQKSRKKLGGLAFFFEKLGELIKGKLGKDLNTADGYKAAERCALSILAQAKKILSGNLDEIKSCIKIVGFVNSTDDFIEQPKVINGASDMLVKVLENKGMHTRAAVSVNSLPLGVAVEIDAIFEIK